MKIIKRILRKNTNQNLLDYAEEITDWYINRTSLKYRKKRGQYFTPRRISQLMVEQFEQVNKKEEIKILDPGAGIGIFESAFCEYMKSVKNVRNNLKISIDLYENDLSLLTLLKRNMTACKRNMRSIGVKFSYKIYYEDFISSNASIFNDNHEKFDVNNEKYDLVISNPPYYKIRKDSPEISKMINIINGAPTNIYPLFMALSAKLLKEGGEMTILTPRSYCSGLHFKKFRKWFFRIVKPNKIHIFESRREVFKKYNVLQEIVILTATKTQKMPKNVSISVSNGIPNKKLNNIKYPYDKIMVEKDDDIIMRIPTSELDELIASHIDKFDNNLNSFGLKVSTGPVVPFRTKDLILKYQDIDGDFFPLIWMHNIVDGKIKWPVDRDDRHMGIRISEESKKISIPNKNYILIKRFSAKEGKQRIVAGIYLRKFLKSDFIGIENHINYIYRKDGELSINEAYGIAALLNSALYNKYFQISNGSTQVNASEIRQMPFPSLRTIRLIGTSVRNLKRDDKIKKECIVLNALKIDKKMSDELSFIK